MKAEIKETLKNSAVIASFVAATTVAVFVSGQTPLLFLAAAIAIIPYARDIKYWLTLYIYNDTKRMVSLLESVGATNIENHPGDRSTDIISFGYNGEIYVLYVYRDSYVVSICDYNWYQVTTGNPVEIAAVLESLNEVNSRIMDVKIALSEPDKNDIRYISTKWNFHSPERLDKTDLTHLFLVMDSARNAFASNLSKRAICRLGSLSFDTAPSAN